MNQPPDTYDAPKQCPYCDENGMMWIRLSTGKKYIPCPHCSGTHIKQTT
jgi:hypothetical protein